MGYGRKAIVEGVYDQRNREGFGPALKHLSEYLNLEIKGLESVIKGDGVSGKIKTKKGVIDIRAHFSDRQRDGRATMHYFVGSKDGKKAKVRVSEIGPIFKRYSGPFTDQ